MANRLYLPFSQWTDSNGDPLAGGKLYFYETGTTTPKDTYSDSGLGTPNANPVVADAAGVFGAIFLGSGNYKVILKTSADATVWTADPVIPVSSSPVSSVGLVMPTGVFDVSGSPVTSSGDITVTFDSQSPNLVFAGPSSGGAAAPSFRALAEADIPAFVPRSYLAGMGISRASATSIGVAAGVCRDSTNVATITLPNSGTINLASTGADGLDTGALANDTWYHVFAIAKTDGTVSRLASTSPASPTMPSGYTLLRRIGSFKTNGSAQVLNFIQSGDWFYWADPPLDFSSSITAGTGATVTLSVPTGIRCMAIVNLNGGAGTQLYVRPTDVDDEAISGTAAPLASQSDGSNIPGGQVQVLTNTSAQIHYDSASTGTQYLATIAWCDRRGRDD